MLAAARIVTELVADKPQAATDSSGEQTFDSTVFRAFEVRDFVEWPAWRRLLRILRANGGSYGLSGPRGSGKSWLMLRAIEWARTARDAGPLGGIGLWYPSPSEYNALAFLASLSDSFATEIDRWFRRNPRVRRRRTIAQATAVLLGFASGGGAAWAIFATTPASALVSGLGGIASAVLVWFVARLLLANLVFPPERRLAAEAEVVRERARYSATRREGLELGAEGGRGFIARAKSIRQRELIERPATLSSLVNDFRALAAEAGDVSGRVVIAIDELDKMAKPDKVRELLRDIKGIFEVPHVHFLVSVSDEAARKLSLGALSDRNEFNSSFYTVIESQPATPEDLADLLEGRGARFPREVGLALAVLAGGNPRETLRLAELHGTATTAGEAATRALREEALTLRREVVTAEDVSGASELGTNVRVGAFAALPDAAFGTSSDLSTIADDSLSTLWDPGWVNDAFETRFGEPWRRLMVRLAVARQLAEAQSLVRDPELGRRLRDVTIAASQSAEVARVVLVQHLRVETREPVVEGRDSREALLGLASSYDVLRETQPYGSDRTAAMTRIVANARVLAREAELKPHEIKRFLESDAAGQRIVGLAAVETTGDPAMLDAVLLRAMNPSSWFEGYHALLALESIWPALGPPEQTHVSRALSPEWRAGLEEDPDRARLADRLMERFPSGDPARATMGRGQK